MGKKLGGSAAAAVLTVVSGSGAAEAAESINLPINQVLSNGSMFSGSFDISGFLSDGLGNNFQVTSAQVQAYGYSNFGTTGYTITSYYTYYYAATGYGGTYYYSCGFAGWSTCSGSWYYTYYVPVTSPNYTAVDAFQDSLLVDVGTGSGLGSDTLIGSPASYFGNIFAMASLESNDIDAANANGLVQFSVGATTNTNIQLSSARLVLELERITSSIPEPKTWAMMSIGLAAVGAGMRKAKRGRHRVTLQN